MPDKTVLVTGATSGIGRALCVELAGNGISVVAVGRNEERLRELSSRSPNIRAVSADLADFERYPSLCESLTGLHGFVHSAGIYQTSLMRFFSAEKHEELMRINVTAPLALVAALVKSKRFNANASIVFLSSILGPVTGLVGSASYAASKAALVGATKTLALELAKYPIRVNCVSPGMVETEMTSGLGYVTEESVRADKARYPLGNRYATTSEVTAPIRFLLSDAASFITGTNLVIDGGCSVA